VAVNLPFGKQVGSRQDAAGLYPVFFAELDRVLRPGGHAVVLSSEYELVKETLRRHKSLVNVTGYSIAVLGQWARLYIVTKTDATGIGP
jgi:23S rRNA G2445 N2-methylase RlmL